MNIKDTARNLFAKKSIRYGVIGLVLLGLIALAYRKPVTDVQTAKVTRNSFEAYSEEEGVTRVKEKFIVYSPVSGVLFRINKHAGDKVKKGEIITSIMMDYRRNIVSPAAGTLLKVYRESEGPIEMGAPLFEVGDVNNLEIVSEILTKEATDIRPGNDVEVSGWGGDPLPGKVRLVEPAAFTKVSSLGVEEQRVRVLIDFKPPQIIAEGYQVRCRIIHKKVSNVLLVPVSALFREQDKWATFTVQKGKALKKYVAASYMSPVSAVITEGLTEGTEVILYPPEGIKDGLKVK